MKLRGLEIGMVFCLLVCAAPAFPAPAGEYHTASYVFGTLAEITVVDADSVRAQYASELVLREFDRMHHDLHAWQEGELVFLNRAIARGERNIPTTPEITMLILKAQRLEVESAGLFDPAVGKLVGLWNFHKDKAGGSLPEPREIAALVRNPPHMSDLKIQGDRVTSSNPTVQLDFGGYAKGYALDRAAEILHAHDIRDALVNVGGNIIALGRHGERPWRVALEAPRGGGMLATVELRDGDAIGTSGDYRRYYEIGGKRYSHIIDPRTGYPVPGVESVTVLVPAQADAGTLSDAASKPIFIEGVEGWRHAAERMGVACALLISSDGVIHVTSAMRSRLSLTDRGITSRIAP